MSDYQKSSYLQIFMIKELQKLKPLDEFYSKQLRGLFVLHPEFKEEFLTSEEKTRMIFKAREIKAYMK